MPTSSRKSAIQSRARPDFFRSLLCPERRLMDAQRRIGGKYRVERPFQLFQLPDSQVLKASVRPEPQINISAVRQTVQQSAPFSGGGGVRRRRGYCRGGGAFPPFLEGSQRIPFVQNPHIVKLPGILFQNGVSFAVHARAAEHRYVIPEPGQIFGQLGRADGADGVLRGKVIADDQRPPVHWPFPPFFAASGKRAGSRVELQQQHFQCSHALRRIRSVSSSVRETMASRRFTTPPAPSSG